MRRLRPRSPVRSPFALWLDAINCRDAAWQRFAGPARFSDDLEQLVARWQAWPDHRRYVLWWTK